MDKKIQRGPFQATIFVGKFSLAMNVLLEDLVSCVLYQSKDPVLAKTENLNNYIGLYISESCTYCFSRWEMDTKTGEKL